MQVKVLLSESYLSKSTDLFFQQNVYKVKVKLLVLQVLM